jgi:hypothetical protein
VRRYVVRTDLEEIGSFISQELVAVDHVVKEVEETSQVLTEDEVELLYPAALAAWRRRDDAIAQSSSELLEASWEAEAAAWAAEPEAWEAGMRRELGSADEK